MFRYISNTRLLFKENNHSWILEHSDKYFMISNEVKSLLDILVINKYDETSYDDFINKFEYVSKNEFTQIVQSNLEALELNRPVKKDKSFINYERQILSKELAGKVSSILQPLYHPRFFWLTFTILIFLALYNIFTIKSYNLDSKLYGFFFIVYILSAFLHELGHIASCRYFTKNNSEVGAGLYIIFPVFYSNISPIWLADKEKRIITNLAGIHVQLIFNLILYMVYLATGNEQINIMIVVSSIITLYQIIPFIRTDGYWILSDITESHNLLQKSNQQVINYLKNPFKFQYRNKRKIFELIYGVFSQIVLLYIVINIFIQYGIQLFTFPQYLLRLRPAELFVYLNNNIHFLISTIIFYLIFYSYAKKIYKKIKFIT